MTHSRTEDLKNKIIKLLSTPLLWESSLSCPERKINKELDNQIGGAIVELASIIGGDEAMQFAQNCKKG